MFSIVAHTYKIKRKYRIVSIGISDFFMHDYYADCCQI